MNKKERLEKIRHFVSDYEVGTQEAIVEYLKNRELQQHRQPFHETLKSWELSKFR